MLAVDEKRVRIKLIWGMATIRVKNHCRSKISPTIPMLHLYQSSIWGLLYFYLPKPIYMA